MLQKGMQWWIYKERFIRHLRECVWNEYKNLKCMSYNDEINACWELMIDCENNSGKR